MLSPVCGTRVFNANILPQSVLFGLHQTRLSSLVTMSTQSKWKIEKNRVLNLPLEEKRKLYKEYTTLDQIDPWCNYVIKNKIVEQKKHTLDDLTEFKKHKFNPELNKRLSERVSIYKGDITKLEIDAIVNAANSSLRGGGGVDGAIHRAAGPLLLKECISLNHCKIGDAKVSGGYDLPAKYIIHTVGPQDGNPADLKSCYERSLSYQQEYHLKSIAFPCISTGIFGFPNRLAAHIALAATRKFLETNDDMERVIFCTFMQVDIDIYETLMQMYFPLHEWNYNEGASVSE